MFLFSLKFRWLKRLLLNETKDVSSWTGQPLFADDLEMEQLKSEQDAQISALFHYSRALFVLCN